MKDEEIKLPPVPSLVTETDWHQAFINYGRESVRLNQPQTESLPFNLEAAKRGEPVLHNGEEARWIGISSIDTDLNIVESQSGVGYADDCDLFMKPKPMRTVYLNVQPATTGSIYETEEKAKLCQKFDCTLVAYPIQIPE